MPTSGSASPASWTSWSAEAPLEGSAWLAPDMQDRKTIDAVSAQATRSATRRERQPHGGGTTSPFVVTGVEGGYGDPCHR